MALDKQLLYTTTPISIKYGALSGTASGFFFMDGEDDESADFGDNYWLITNRHVAFYKDNIGNEFLIDELSFKVRYNENDTGKLGWIDIILTKEDLKNKAKVHKDRNIDVAVIDIYDVVKNLPDNAVPNNATIYVSPIKTSQLPDKCKFPIEVCDDTVCIGYPRNFYDTANLYPVAKSGIIATQWNANFENSPRFLIDLQLFPGSSGSLVISKPRMEDLDENGFLVFRSNKVFYFLGVYSGEPVQINKIVEPGLGLKVIEQKFNFGNVWYSYLIPEIINNGVFVK